MAQENGMAIINKQIEERQFEKLYLFGGGEKYLVEQYRKNLVDAMISADDTMNKTVYKNEAVKVDEIRETAMTMPFFAEHRVLEIHDSDFFKKGNEEMEKLFEELPETTTIVFVEDNIDKRCKLYKIITKLGTVAMFETPDERTLLIWVKKLFTDEKMQIADEAVYRLVEGVGTNMNHLVMEAEKLKSYCLEKGKVTVDDVNLLCVDQVEGKIFDMMDALSKRDKPKTISLYDDLLQLREPAMRILALITRQFHILLKIKLILETGGEYGKIATAVKIPPFTVKKYVDQCKGYTYGELLECTKWCQETDEAIKSGRMRDSMAVEMLILKLLQ